MRHVDFDPKTLTGEHRAWWTRWSAIAQVATNDLLRDVARGRVPRFRKSVWAELKNWLLEHVFHGKCAYCEGRFIGGYVGDAEHYRPKGEVTVKENGSVRTISNNGYYWLAYDWRNLLPSCQLCNGGNGKHSQFPVAAEHAFTGGHPTGTALNEIEQPLLLNPYEDDPSEHLRFGVKGTIAPAEGSQRGEHSIAVYDLSREALDVERERCQTEARNAFILALIANVRDGESIDSAMKQHISERAPFSTAVRDYLLLNKQKLSDDLASAFEQVS